MTYEHDRALMEGARNSACDDYFSARPQIDTIDRRRVYEAGFQAGAASRDAEIAELVEDKGRLDFLDGNSRFKMGWSVGQSPVGNLSISAVIQLGKEPTTIREAIDTALAKVRKP